MLRVARRRVVILTWDITVGALFWLTAYYFPQITAFDATRFRPVRELADALGGARIMEVPIPHDCQDGFLAAFWAKPEEYLSPWRRAAISGFAQMPADVLREGLGRLANDLQSGVWDQRFGWLRNQKSLDAGYRLLIAEAGTRTIL